MAQEGLENREASTQRNASGMEMEQIEKAVYFLLSLLRQMWKISRGSSPHLSKTLTPASDLFLEQSTLTMR